MAYACVMESVVSFPWCAFSSRTVVACLQLLFYIWPIDALPVDYTLPLEKGMSLSEKHTVSTPRCYPPVSSHFSPEALYVLFLKNSIYNIL